MSFRTVAVLSTLLVVPLAVAWFLGKWRPYAQEERAIAALRARGSQGDRVSVTWSQAESKFERLLPMLGRPRQFNIAVFGGEVDLSAARDLRMLVSLDLDSTRVRDGSEEAFSGLTLLQRLSMLDTDVPCGTWAHVARLENLRSLSLKNVHLGDEGLAQLANLRSLRSLGLVGPCGLTDDGLVHLRDLGGLESLAIRGLPLTASGVCHLKDLPQLKGLSLVSCGLTDQALEPLALLPSLRSLDVSDNPISDKGLETIARIRALEVLSLNRTRITDDGLAVFQGRSERLHVEVKGTSVTEAGMARVGDISGKVGRGPVWFNNAD